MSESTTESKCTAWEWKTAAKSGLMSREQGTNSFDEAIHSFAEMVREEMNRMNSDESDIGEKK